MPPASLIPSSSAAAVSLLRPPSSSPLSKQEDSQFRLRIPRRDAVLISIVTAATSLHPPASAAAFSIGISGPKDWLREQKKKASKILLAPIDASRNSLRNAYLLLTNTSSDFTDKDLEEVHRLLITAARDCVAEDRNSFVAFQASTGVEVCTFRLIVKNAASLLDNKDPIKLEAEANLNDLIRSFASLNGMASETDIRLLSKRQKLTDALVNTLSSLDKFEQGIKNCLEI